MNTSLGRTSKQQIETPAQPTSPQYTVPTPDNSDMAELFRKLGLDKYTELFLQQEVILYVNMLIKLELCALDIGILE